MATSHQDVDVWKDECRAYTSTKFEGEIQPMDGERGKSSGVCILVGPYAHTDIS